MRRFLILSAAVVMYAAGAAAEPRIAPALESAWTPEQREMVATYWKGPVGNDVRTFAVNPALVKGISPFANYILSESTLSPRHRALLILRAAWLAESDYLWGKHAKQAAEAGLSAAEIQRIAEGPAAKAWPAFEAALLRAADELHNDSSISTPTWTTLAGQYSKAQLIDATFTVAEFTMIATTLNSLRVEPDKGFAALPKNVARPKAGARGFEPVATPRIPPLMPEQWTPEQAALVDPKGLRKPVFAVLSAFVQHPAMYVKRQTISDHIRGGTSLTTRVREMAILRILARCRGDAEWSGHVAGGKNAGIAEADIPRLAAPGYAGFAPADADIVRAVDELYDANRVSDETWKALSAQFDQRQLMDLLVTAGGYRMVAMAINAFGVPLEPGRERVPVHSR